MAAEIVGLLMMIFGGTFAAWNIYAAIIESRMDKRLFNDAPKQEGVKE